jgi:hypothetical protein
MRFLLVLFERGDKHLVETEWEKDYGLSEDSSKPNLEMSVLLSSNLLFFYVSLFYIMIAIGLYKYT